MPPVPTEPLHGHLRGTATTGDGEVYHVEAILTVDGVLRMHLGGPTDQGGGIQAGGGISYLDGLMNPENALLFVGNLDMAIDQNVGAGLLIGQTCGEPSPGPLCDEPAPAEVSITQLHDPSGPGNGAIRIQTSEGVELWTLDVGRQSLYYDGAAVIPRGTFDERLAAFANDGDTVINLDDGGRLFFQSAGSGCIGNGTLAPHLDGQYHVLDASLLIENCGSGYAYLNGAFEGLVTETQDGYWDYDDWLVMLMSTADGSEPRRAVAFFAAWLSGDLTPCVACDPWGY